MTEMKGALIIGKEWTPRKCPLTTSFVQREFAITLAKRRHPVYFTALSATEEEKEDVKRNRVHLILPDPKLKMKMDEQHMFVLHEHTFPHLKNYKTISVIFGHACENGTAEAALTIKKTLFKNAIFIPFYYEIPEDMGLDPETLQNKVDEMMEYAEAAFALVSVGTNIYNHNENMYRHLNKQKHLPYIPWIGEEFEKFEVPQTTVDTKIEVYSLHTVRESRNFHSLEAAAIAMGKVAYFYTYDKVQPQWKIRGIPNNCCKECQNFLNEKADSSSLKITIYPPLSDKMKQDLKQCHLLAVFTTEGDPFGMIGLLGCAAGVPSLVSKSTGFASFIEAEFPEFNSVVCDIGPAETAEGASEKWKERIMKTLKNYDVARNIEQKLMAKLNEDAKDGFIANYHTNLINFVSKHLEDDQTKKTNEEYKNTEETGTNETTTSPEEVQEVSAENTHQEQSDNGSNQNGDDRSSIHIQLEKTVIGIVEVRITVSDSTPNDDHGGTPAEEIKKKAISMLNEIRTPNDLPRVEKHLRSIGPITIRLVKEGSLCVVLDCETSESVEKLWLDYRRGKLKTLFTDDIGTAERLQRYRVSAVALEVSLPRWQYRRAVVQLKYLKEGYEPNDVPSDLCQICGKMVATAESSLALSQEGDTTSYVAVELERSISESDKRKARLILILGGDGTYEIDIPVQTTDKEVWSIMLFKVKTPQQVSALAKERPEILGALGINRYLNLDTSQLSRVRSEHIDGKSCQYDAMELKTMIEDSGVVVQPTASKALAQQQDPDLTERLFRIFELPATESPATNTYLHTVTLMYDEQKIQQQLKLEYTSLKDQYQILKLNHEEIVKKEEEKAAQLGIAITKLTGEKLTTIDVMKPDSERKQSVDTNIEGDITPYVAVEIERCISESDIRKAELTKILGGGGTYEIDIPVQTTGNELSSIMLFKVQTPQQVSALAKERPEILGVLGINRYLNLDTSQLSRVRSEEEDGKNCQYDVLELKATIEENGVATASEPLVPQRDSDLIERLFRILESPTANTYLHTVTLMYYEHKIQQRLKSIERDYTSLQNQYHTMEANYEEIVKKEEEKAAKLGNAITKLTEEKLTLLKTVDGIMNPESERRPSVDQLIEEFSFKFDDTQQSCEEILHKLPCHFTWKLDLDISVRFEYLMIVADNMLKHHGDLAPVPNKALKGYLYVSKLRSEYEKDPKAALKWFNEALADNKKELGRCDDNDGPLGDKLVILADVAWVHFLFGEKEKVSERLSEIANLFVGKLTEKRKSYIYGHKGVACLYFQKGANDEGIDGLQQALLAFPKKIDWLVLLAFLLLLKIQRIFDDLKCREASMMVYRIKHLVEKILEINPNHGCAMAVLGQLYTYVGQHDKAKPYVERALDLHPTSPTILGEVLNFFIDTEDFDRALKIVHNALKHKKESPQLMYLLGEIYGAKCQRHPSLEINSQLLPKSLQCYDEAIKLAGGVFHPAVFAKAGVLSSMNKPDEMKEMLTKLIDGGTLTCPFYKSWAYYYLARTYILLNDDRNAWIHFNKAVNIGSEYREGKRAARGAIMILEKRLEREGKNEYVLRAMGSMHMKLREFEKACEYFLEAFSL